MYYDNHQKYCYDKIRNIFIYDVIVVLTRRGNKELKDSTPSPAVSPGSSEVVGERISLGPVESSSAGVTEAFPSEGIVE